MKYLALTLLILASTIGLFFQATDYVLTSGAEGIYPAYALAIWLVLLLAFNVVLELLARKDQSHLPEHLRGRF